VLRNRQKLILLSVEAASVPRGSFGLEPERDTVQQQFDECKGASVLAPTIRGRPFVPQNIFPREFRHYNRHN
jgi:hypothetical protein